MRGTPCSRILAFPGGWRLVTANNHVQAIRAYNADGPEPFHAD